MTDTPVTIDHPALYQTATFDIDRLPSGLFGVSLEVNRPFHVRQLAETEISRNALLLLRDRINEILGDDA